MRQPLWYHVLLMPNTFLELCSSIFSFLVFLQSRHLKDFLAESNPFYIFPALRIAIKTFLFNLLKSFHIVGMHKLLPVFLVCDESIPINSRGLWPPATKMDNESAMRQLPWVHQFFWVRVFPGDGSTRWFDGDSKLIACWKWAEKTTLTFPTENEKLLFYYQRLAGGPAHLVC